MADAAVAPHQNGEKNIFLIVERKKKMNYLVKNSDSPFAPWLVFYFITVGELKKKSAQPISTSTGKFTIYTIIECPGSCIWKRMSISKKKKCENLFVSAWETYVRTVRPFLQQWWPKIRDNAKVRATEKSSRPKSPGKVDAREGEKEANAPGETRGKTGVWEKKFPKNSQARKKKYGKKNPAQNFTQKKIIAKNFAVANNLNNNKAWKKIWLPKRRTRRKMSKTWLERPPWKIEKPLLDPVRAGALISRIYVFESFYVTKN